MKKDPSLTEVIRDIFDDYRDTPIPMFIIVLAIMLTPRAINSLNYVGTKVHSFVQSVAASLNEREIRRESTPEWADSMRNMIALADQRINEQCTIIEKVNQLTQSTSLDSDYSEHLYLVHLRNDLVRRYQIAMMRNLQGLQYKGAEKALPQVIDACPRNRTISPTS